MALHELDLMPPTQPVISHPVVAFGNFFKQSLAKQIAADTVLATLAPVSVTLAMLENTVTQVIQVSLSTGSLPMILLQQLVWMTVDTQQMESVITTNVDAILGSLVLPA